MKTIEIKTDTLIPRLSRIAFALRKHLVVFLAGVVMVLTTATTSRAEVKIVQMKISGYLCGN